MKETKESPDSQFIKPLTSFLKDSSTILHPISNARFLYPDKENSDLISHKAFPSVTQITPLYDAGMLKSQHKALVGLSDQVRQLKLNNESLAKNNLYLNRDLEEKDNKLRNYEDVMLKLYNERPPKDLGSSKHKFLPQDQREIDKLMNDIMRRKEEDGMKNGSDDIQNLTNTNFLFARTKDANIQVDLPFQNQPETDLRINLDLSNSPHAKAGGSPKHKRGGSPSHSHSPKHKQTGKNVDKKEFKLIKRMKDIVPEEKLAKLRLDISQVFNKIKDVNIRMSTENLAFTMSLPYFLEEDAQEQIVQFKDFELYNLSSRLGFGSKLYNCIKNIRYFFNGLTKMTCFRTSKAPTLTYSHQDLFQKYDPLLHYESKGAYLEMFLAFISLFDDIPTSDSKESIRKKLILEEEETLENISKRRTSKFKSKVLNLETKFLVFVIRECLKDHCEVFKLYFNEKRAVYLFFRFRIDADENRAYLKKNRDFSFKLNKEFLEVLKFEPFDPRGVPISLKIQLNMLSYEELTERQTSNKNRVVPQKNENEKTITKNVEKNNAKNEKKNQNVKNPTKDNKKTMKDKENESKGENEQNENGKNKENEENKEILENEKKGENEENKNVQVPITPEKPQRNEKENKIEPFNLGNVHRRSEMFNQQKKLFLQNVWWKVQEILDFSCFFMVSKNKLIMTRDYRLTPQEIDLHQRFLDRFSLYLSNKLLLNYDNNHEIKLFSLDARSPELRLLLKQLDFKMLAFMLNTSMDILLEEGAPIANYYQRKNLKRKVVWLQGNEDFLPDDFIDKYVILPPSIEQNAFHSFANYYAYYPETYFQQVSSPLKKEKIPEEMKQISILFEKRQIHKKILEEIRNEVDFGKMKKEKCLAEVYNFGLFQENVGSRFNLTDHIGFFQIFPNDRLFTFYEKLQVFLGLGNSFIVVLCDFLSMSVKLLILPGIANFVLMSYFDRFSLEYKITIDVYSFLLLGLFILIGKVILRRIQEFKEECGLITLQVKDAKTFNLIEKKNVTKEKNKIKQGFCLILLKIMVFCLYILIFLAFLLAKVYISYGFNLLKIKWAKNQTVFKFNKYFDGNQFFPDLFDFLLLYPFIILFKKILIRANLRLFNSEQKIKDGILVTFRVFCEFNNFFQIIFIYPEINSCALDDCLTMSQTLYKNRLILYFFYRGSYWLYCLMKYQNFQALNRSIEKTLLSRSAFRNANIINPANESPKKTEKEPIFNKFPEKEDAKEDEGDNERKPHEMDLEAPPMEINIPMSTKSKGFKYLHLCELTNKIVINGELDSLFYTGTMIEKSYELYIDLFVVLLYMFSFSSMFSLDVVYFWFILFFESYFLKYKLLFLYKNFHLNGLEQFENWRNIFVFVLMLGTIFNVGHLAFLYDGFFGYYPVMLFFVICIFIWILIIGVYVILDDNPRGVKERLIKNRDILLNFFNFLKI